MLYWLPLCLGLLFAYLLLQHARTNWLVKLDEAAYGAETHAFNAGADSSQTQCAAAANSEQCVSAYLSAGSPEAVIWLGNSQLMAINRIKQGDVNAPFLLHQSLTKQGRYLVTYSIPNANLSEHALTIDAIASRYKTRTIILPVVYDDLREQGIRSDVADFAKDPAVAMRLAGAPYWQEIKPLLNAKGQEQGQNDSQRTPTQQTVQARAENNVVAFLGKQSALFESRPNLSGMLGFAIHTLRNKALGIHSTTKRKVDPGVYKQRLELLEQIIARIRSQGIHILVYIPPYRRDIDGPYIESDYQQFKMEVARIAKKHDAQLADLESIVPGPEWGTVTDPLFGIKEHDFMHFTADGHKRLAAALDSALSKSEQ